MALISEALINQYKNNIELLQQQKGSKLEGAVRNETQNSEFFFFDQLNAFSTYTENPARNADTVLIAADHLRRRVHLDDIKFAVMVNKFDDVRMLADPNSAYVSNTVKHFGRIKDIKILACAGGTAYAGHAGATSVTFSGTMSIPASGTVGVDTNAAYCGATTTMNLSKLRGAKLLLDNNDVDTEDRYIVCNPKIIWDLLGTTEVTSADYNAVRALVNGQVNQFLGFTFITISDTILPISAGLYTTYFWHKDSMLLSLGEDMGGLDVRVEERADKNYSTQIFNQMAIGCTRMEENGVGRIYST
jgi:hypothetical protein